MTLPELEWMAGEVATRRRQAVEANLRFIAKVAGAKWRGR